MGAVVQNISILNRNFAFRIRVQSRVSLVFMYLFIYFRLFLSFQTDFWLYIYILGQPSRRILTTADAVVRNAQASGGGDDPSVRPSCRSIYLASGSCRSFVERPHCQSRKRSPRGLGGFRTVQPGARRTERPLRAQWCRTFRL